MGRPIGKEFFGSINEDIAGSPSADGKDAQGRTTTGATFRKKDKGFNIPVAQARIPGGDADIGGDAAETPFIIAQKGSKKYRVSTSSGAGNCVLVNDDGSSTVGDGEMVILGYTDGDSGNSSGIAIAKLTKHYAVDFNGNRYKWHVENRLAEDSSLANTLMLTVATSNIS